MPSPRSTVLGASKIGYADFLALLDVSAGMDCQSAGVRVPSILRVVVACVIDAGCLEEEPTVCSPSTQRKSISAHDTNSRVILVIVDVV